MADNSLQQRDFGRLECGHPVGCLVESEIGGEEECGWCRALAQRDQAEELFRAAVRDVEGKAYKVSGGEFHCQGPIAWLFVRGGTAHIEAGTTISFLGVPDGRVLADAAGSDLDPSIP